MQVRDAAVATLGILGDARAVGPIIEADLDEAAHLKVSDEGMSATFSFALEDIGAPAVERLIAMFTHGNDHLQNLTRDVLCGTYDVRAIEPLIDAQDQPDANLRKIAAEALGGLNATPALPALEKLQHDANADVRKAAIDAIRQIKEH